MSVAILESLLERRFNGAAVHGRAAAVTGWNTGIPSVDGALGPTGIPHGRLTEIFGCSSSGKTTFAYALLAACTSRGDIGAYVDPQHSLFAPAAQAAGIDLERLIVVRPCHAHAQLRAIDALVRSGACAVVVLDGTSAGALQTHQCARLVSQAEKNGTTLVALSCGENPALASFASLRVRMRALVPVWQPGSDGGGRLSGYSIALDIAKSRIGAPGKSAAFESYLRDVAGSWSAGPAHHPTLIAEEEAGDDDAHRATIA